MARKVSYLAEVTKMIFVVIACIVALEIAALIWLGTTVGRYKNYWQERAKQSGEITYLALGDSASQGIGASTPNKGFVGLIAKRLENKYDKQVKVVNLSITGAKLDDYLKEQAPKVKYIKADFVTIEIGSNDIKNYNADEFTKNFRLVLETLPDGSYVSNMPLFNSRPGSTANAKLASKIVENELKKYPKLKFVDLEKQTSDNQSIFGFAPDLFHPNDLSYKNWANAFWNQIDKER